MNSSSNHAILVPYCASCKSTIAEDNVHPVLQNNSRISVKKSQTYDWSPTTQGLILGSFYYGYIVLQVPAGRLSERFGGKTIALIGLIVSGFVTLITPLIAFSLPLIVSSRVTLGLAQGLIIPAIFDMNHKWMPENQRSLGFGIMTMGSMIGAAGGSAATGFICEFIGWEYSFFGIGVLAVFFTIAIWLPIASSSPCVERVSMKSESNKNDLLQRKENSLATKPPVSWMNVLSNSAVIAAACCRACGYGSLVLQTRLPAYLANVMGLPASQNGLINSYLFLGPAFMAVIGPYVSEILISKSWMTRTNARKLFASLSYYPLTLGFIAVPFAGCNSTLAIAVLIVGNLFTGLYVAGEVIVPAEMSHHYSSTIYSGISMLTGFSGFLAPLIIGLILEGAHDGAELKHRWDLVFFMTACVTGFGTTVFVLLGSAERQTFDMTMENVPALTRNRL
jgi:MFS family permease